MVALIILLVLLCTAATLMWMWLCTDGIEDKRVQRRTSRKIKIKEDEK